MKRLIPALFLSVLPLVACGGGNDTGPMNAPVNKYEPSQERWEDASEVYARAIETLDEEMIERVLAPGEKDKLESFKANFKKSKEDGVTWRIEYPKSSELNEEKAAVMISYYQTKDGNEEVTQKEWIIFIKQDGLWYYSPDASAEFLEKLKRNAEEQNSADDGEQPANGTDAGSAD